MMRVRALVVTIVAVAACGADGAPGSPGPPGPPGERGAGGPAGTAAVAANGAPGEPGARGPTGDAGPSGIARATEPLGNVTGPLPKTGGFLSNGGSLVVTVSGTAWCSLCSGFLGFDVAIDTTTIGSINAFANEGNSHKTLPTRVFVVPDVAAGSHTVTVSAQANTTTDAADYFNVTVVEFR